MDEEETMEARPFGMFGVSKKQLCKKRRIPVCGMSFVAFHGGTFKPFPPFLFLMGCTRQMLGAEERKEEARNALETAVQSRSLEMLEDAPEEVKGQRQVGTTLATKIKDCLNLLNMIPLDTFLY